MNVLNSFKAPVSANLEITEICNLQCFFCYCSTDEYKANRGKVSNDIKNHNLLRILDILAQNEILEVRFLGGEFVLFPGWKDLVRRSGELGFFMSFVSNGTAFKESDIHFLAENGIEEGSISIHGLGDLNDEITGLKGGFDKAVKNLAAFLGNKMNVNVLFTPNKRNMYHFEEFAKAMIDDYGSPSVGLNRIFRDSRYESLTLDDYLFLLGRIEKLQNKGYKVFFVDSFPICKVPMRFWKFMGNCSQGVGFCHIDYMGNIKNCSSLGACLGNIFEKEMRKIWRDELSEFVKLGHLPLSCRLCPIFCGGGCIASRVKENLFVADEFIDLPAEESLSKTLWLLANNYAKKMVSRLKSNKDKLKPREYASDYVPCANFKFKIRHEEGDLFICMIKGKGTFFLNKKGKTVIDFIDGKRSVGEIVQATGKYLNRNITKEDVSEILQFLD